MKTTLLFLAVASAAIPALAVGNAVPGAFPSARYEPMVAKSPFALATPVAPVAAPDKSFADGWYMSGVAQYEGKNYITVRSRDLSVQFSLFGDERHDNGVKLQTVDWSPALGRTAATIEKDGQFAKVELLNQSELQTSTPQPMPAVNPGAAPGVLRPGNVGGVKPGASAYPGVPSQPRAVIPRPSGQPAMVPQAAYPITGTTSNPATIQPTQPGAAPQPAGDGRRRIRMIPTAPSR